MKLKLVFADTETFWSETHTLSKMPTIDYVTSPLTDIISVAIKQGDAPTEVYFGDEIAAAVQAIDWSDKLLVFHNASFDAPIWAWRLGVQPAMWGCTAAMARGRYDKICGVSLAKLVRELNIGVKDNSALMNTKGRRLKDFMSAEVAAMREYNKADTEQCAALFRVLVKQVPRGELELIHLTTQMLTNPKFVLDTAMTEAALCMERDQKRAALLALAKELRQGAPVSELDWGDDDAVAEFVRSELASATRFSALLECHGVPTPMKASPTNPDKQTPALAKTDQAFLDLQEHEHPVVAAAARTRLSVKSTILETRLQAFLNTAKVCDGRVPVPLKYAGASTTGRWSGEHYNMQNLPRVSPTPKPADALRNGLRAPKGHKIVVSDLSGIELRVNHFLWQVESSMTLYKRDPAADLYRAFAAVRYGVAESEVTKAQRHLAKVAHLGLGFGSGPATFRRIAKTMGGIDLTQEESEDVVAAWRDAYSEIVRGWKRCHAVLPRIFDGMLEQIDPWGLCTTEHEAIRLPSGRKIYYPGLRKAFDADGKAEWVYGEGRHRTKIYSAKIDENLVQAIARDVLGDIILRVYRKYRIAPVLLVHDEFVTIVPTADADDTLRVLNEEMRKPPAWWPELVLHSEGDIGDRYGEAK